MKPERIDRPAHKKECAGCIFNMSIFKLTKHNKAFDFIGICDYIYYDSVPADYEESERIPDALSKRAGEKVE